MSDTTVTPTPAPPAQAAPEAPKVDETDWKAEARKWEDRAKANKEAADRLASIEEASKSEAQKAADRAAAAEKKAVEAEAKVARRDVAIEHKLSKEDAALLDTITDEAAMRALAARLSTAQADADAERKRTGGIAPKEGGSADTKTKADSDEREFVRGLFGRQD